MRIDNFLAEKYHYTPSEIANLTPVECLWLCVTWDDEGENLKLTADMDATTRGIIKQRHKEIIEGRLAYQRLTAEEKLRLAELGICCERDYIKHG